MVLKSTAKKQEPQFQSDPNKNTIDAIEAAFAVIEFEPDGTIIKANAHFLNALGYSLSEVQGKHHRMFVEAQMADSIEYRRFWNDLANGIEQTREFKRVTKHGEPIWIKASYMPVKDELGHVQKVIKIAIDCTEDRKLITDLGGKVQAISKSQAMIEFNMDGTIISANDNFLQVMGYSIREIEGKHHSMFVEDSFRSSNDYRQFWEKLRRGDHDAAQYKRIGKGGKEVWIQASYNPILDINGVPTKVMKIASDITDKVKLIGDLSEASSQVAASSQELSASAQQMSQSSTETLSQATQAASASEQVSRGVEVVATNTEEMQASIKEIARNATTVSRKSNETKQQAQSTNQTIQKLSESSKEIGNVIKVISSIAQQTNLLALNATIEAARAGDAGRGFAVVANEVKELAKQTARATEDITNKIGAIQTDSSDAVTAISGIGQSIDELNSIAGAIAASVEEQSATTAEVARVVKESNIGVQSITNNVKLVSTAAGQTSQGSGQVLSAAQELQQLAARLQDMVKRVQN